MRLSRRTLAALVAAIAAGRGHAWLNQQFYGLGLEDTDPNTTVHSRSLALVQRLEQGARTLDGKPVDEQEREAALLDLAIEVLQAPGTGDFRHRDRLINALRADGFEWGADRLTPTTPGPLALAPRISLLESELEAAGFEVSLGHYRQAVDNLTAGNPAACNSQVRPFLEDLYCQVGERLTGLARRDPVAAITDLKTRQHVDAGEWNMLRGFWETCQTQGPHRGLSDLEEAEMRLQQATTAARLLLRKLRGT